MSGPEFFQTGMGRTFYEGTMPQLAKALERLAAAVEKSNEPRVELAVAPPEPHMLGTNCDLGLLRAAGFNAGVYRDAIAMAMKWATEQVTPSTAGESPRKLIADDVFELLRGRIPPAEQEAFFIVAVNVRNGLIGEPTMVGFGHIHGVEVHPREVFRDAVRKAAAGIVVAHNHPSGDPVPSQEDIELTKRLRAAGEIIGIPVVDHLVITSNGYRSIAEHMGAEF